MNRSQLIDSISEETTFTKKDVARFLDSLIRNILRTLKKGGKVQLAGFGTWTVSRREARVGINPSTKESINLPPVNVTKFKAGNALRECVRSVIV